MPGLSNNPDAAKRQLDGLQRGRQRQARGLLESLGFTVQPARKPGRKAAEPGHVPGQPAVHTYPPDDEPEPPNGPSAPAREPDEPEPQRPAGFFSRLADGLRAGVED